MLTGPTLGMIFKRQSGESILGASCEALILIERSTLKVTRNLLKGIRIYCKGEKIWAADSLTVDRKRGRQKWVNDTIF